MELQAIYQTLGVSPEVVAYGEAALERLRDRFADIDRTAEYNQAKVLRAMLPHRVHAAHSAAPPGLGQVNYILRAMRIPAGDHKVEMVFDPESQHVTGGIAYASVTLIYLLLAGAIFMPVLRIKKSADIKNR